VAARAFENLGRDRDVRASVVIDNHSTVANMAVSAPRTFEILMLIDIRPSHPSTPDLCSRACTSASTHTFPQLYARAHSRNGSRTHTNVAQRRQRYRRKAQVGRDRIQGQTRVRRPLHEHPAVQHRRIRQRRQLRDPRPGAHPLQQRAVDWASGWR
jgi:hypothetical protein